MKLYTYFILVNYMGSLAIFEIPDYRTMAPIAAFSWPVWVRIFIVLEIPILISCYKLSGYSNIDGFPALFLLYNSNKYST